jgi:type I restriction enzyme M protein
VQTELNRISQALTGRIKELAERYAIPLPELSSEVEILSSKVTEHLKKMGFILNNRFKGTDDGKDQAKRLTFIST